MLPIALILLRVKLTHEIYLLFLIWNLFLAYIPCLLSSKIKTTVPNTLSFYLILLSWLLFLPNTFYLITDFIHLRHINSQQYTFDIVLLSSFTIAGFYAGLLSLKDIHLLLQMKYNRQKCWSIISCIIYLSAFAIYLGRILRFNSWDILSNPISLLYYSSKSIFNFDTVLFTITFGSFLWLVYNIFFYLTNKTIIKSW
ncbi:DUF1361 domain-containing protein [Flavobacterium phycosphaerae]|uniref:DUF1361 domain-containing protein n=1 Tax=Flavobacterium phycosphaerae TaxID=2697515 RepID=UPI00138AEEE4|nr:DUF1361 domain-containing protein [Flavobacterium phycosphaerae]